MLAPDQSPASLPDRILDALLVLNEEEIARRVLTTANRWTPQSLALTRQHYEGILKGFKAFKDLTPEEKKTLQFIRHDLRKIKARQKPNWIKRFWFSRPVNWLVNRLKGHQKQFRDQDRQLADYERGPITNLNAASLQDAIQSYKFKNQMEGSFKRRLAYNPDNFSVGYFEIAKRDTHYQLHFEKVKGTDTFVFAGFDATHILSEEEKRQGKTNPLTVSFRTTDKIKFTAEEAAVIVADRPLKKNIDGQSAWVIANRKTSGLTHLRFDLPAALRDLPILEMKTPDRDKLIAAIAGGKDTTINMQLPDGSKEPFSIKLAVNDKRNGLVLKLHDSEGSEVNLQKLLQDRNMAKMLLNSINKQKAKIKRPAFYRAARV